jgi:polyferredoxin
MLYALMTRSLLEINIMHDRNPLFVQLSNGDIRNGYDLKILNKSREPKTYALSLEGLPDAQITLSAVDEVTPDHLPVPANSVGQFKVFIHALRPAESPVSFKIIVIDPDTRSRSYENTMFVSEKPHG